MKTQLHTLRFGHAPWMDICVPTLEAYAGRHGYELKVWADDAIWCDYPCPKFCEIDMVRAFLASDADRMLYVDADIYVNAEAPEFPVAKGIALATDPWHDEHLSHWREWCEANLGLKPKSFAYCNAGVWAVDRPTAKKLLAVMEETPMVEFFQEQHWFNACVYKVKSNRGTVTRLSNDWNRWGRDFNPAWFRHFWGEEKERDIQTLRDIGLLDKAPDGMIYCLMPRHWPTSDKVVVHEFIQDAGLGNQIFEASASYGIAKRLGLPLLWSWKPSGLREFGLRHFRFAETRINLPLVAKKMGQGNAELVKRAEKAILASEGRFCGISCPFQAEECFEDVAGEVRGMFPLEPFPLDCPEGKNPVGVQVRRGDYVKHPRLNVVTPDYFRNAMKWVRRKLPNPHFFIVSDDPAWCREQFAMLPDVTVMPDQSAIDGLRTLASCEAHIISNSTFGWWGAWLGEKGPVVVPEIWHHKPGAYGKWNPVPDRWVKIPVKPEAILGSTDFSEAEVSAPLHDRAIVYPWHSDLAVWHELRYSLRSIHEHFEDKDCPIYILGNRRPPWLLFGQQRVIFLQADTYREALVKGTQLAEKVLWMNDDIALLKPTTWADCARVRYLREVGPDFLERVAVQSNPWRAGCVKVLQQLADEGVTEQKVFSTHLPYVYEREKSLEVFRRFGVWNKFPMELAYFHLHGENPVLLNGERATAAPFGDARFLNYTDRSLTSDLKTALTAAFPRRAPWEVDANFWA